MAKKEFMLIDYFLYVSSGPRNVLIDALISLTNDLISDTDVVSYIMMITATWDSSGPSSVLYLWF